MAEKKDGDPDPNCKHETIEHNGGFGDQSGTWETFQCRACGWIFFLESLDS